MDTALEMPMATPPFQPAGSTCTRTRYDLIGFPCSLFVPPYLRCFLGRSLSVKRDQGLNELATFIVWSYQAFCGLSMYPVYVLAPAFKIFDLFVILGMAHSRKSALVLMAIIVLHRQGLHKKWHYTMGV